MRAMTEAGFVRPGYAQLLEEQKTRAQTLFGPDIDVSEQSVFGKFLRLGVHDLAMLYEEMEEVYLARFPHMAYGVSLDRLTPFAGLRRNNATAAIHRLEVQGTSGAVMPFGCIVSTPQGIGFHVVNEVQLDETGIAKCEVVCTVLGEVGNVDSTSICVLSQPQAGIHRVKGEALLQAGQDVESDESLRRRFDEAVYGVASATAAAVQGAVLRVPGVRSCVVLENSTGEDLPQLPAHSFQCFVLASGASDKEIALAIYEKKPLGIQSVGSVEVLLPAIDGESHRICFSTVEKKNLSLRAVIRANSHFPSDGDLQLKTALSEAVCALLPGESLLQNSLYSVLYAQVGVDEVESLLLSEDGAQTFHANKILADAAEVLWLNIEEVEVEVHVS